MILGISETRHEHSARSFTTNSLLNNRVSTIISDLILVNLKNVYGKFCGILAKMIQIMRRLIRKGNFFLERAQNSQSVQRLNVRELGWLTLKEV